MDQQSVALRQNLTRNYYVLDHVNKKCHRFLINIMEYLCLLKNNSAILKHLYIFIKENQFHFKKIKKIKSRDSIGYISLSVP